MVLVDSHGISRVPRYSGTRHESARCRLRGCHPLWPIVPDRSTSRLIGNSLALHQTGPTTPSCKHDGLGYVRVRSPLLAESLLFSSPPGTEMVHFPGLPPSSLWIQLEVLRYEPEWVSPFGNPRVKACLRLTEAYRSLPRPSSTPGAKAFTVRP
jgi:hypothetical protein